MRFWNSQSGELKEFIPSDPNRVTMYVCGPTVYSTPHIGNLRPAVVFDQLFRLLRYKYGNDHVVYTSNYTDIDDKIIARSNAEGVPVNTITDQSIVEYEWSRFMLNIENPTTNPRATEYVEQMIDMISSLIDKGHAYVGENGDVLFRSSSNKNPGMEDSRKQGESRIEDYVKEDQKDFVLWKLRKPDEPFWDSPWGEGRPGWHIECSAMIASTLGETIDIHGGGSDLKFPHHNAEMAQSSCAHNAPLANNWLHSGMIQLNNVKMAKSLGNIVSVRNLLTLVPNEAVRLWILSTHYRSDLKLEMDHNTPPCQVHRGILDQMYRFLFKYRSSVDWRNNVAPAGDIIEALEDDLNTPLALTRLHMLFDHTKRAEGTKEFPELLKHFVSSAHFLGILYYDPDDWFHRGVNSDEIEQLISERKIAKEKKDWIKADSIRQKISDLGVLLEDNKADTFWCTKQGAILRS